MPVLWHVVKHCYMITRLFLKEKAAKVKKKMKPLLSCKYYTSLRKAARLKNIFRPFLQFLCPVAVDKKFILSRN